MDRVNGTNREQLWRDRIAQQKVSGLSISKFCRQGGFSEPSYYYWKRRLANVASSSTKPVGQKQESNGHFLAVDLTPKCHGDGLAIPSAPNQESQRKNSLEIVLHDGRRIVVPDQFEPDTLRSILAILEESVC